MTGKRTFNNKTIIITGQCKMDFGGWRILFVITEVS